MLTLAHHGKLQAIGNENFVKMAFPLQCIDGLYLYKTGIYIVLALEYPWSIMVLH